MADQATFHAKISADAREFIAQIENAGDAVKGLVTSTSQLGNIKAPSGGDSGSVAKEAESEMRRLQQEAMASSDQIAEKNRQNIEAEAAARAAAINKNADLEETREEQIQRLMSAGITRNMAERMAGQTRLRVDMSKLSKEEQQVYRSILKYQGTMVANEVKRRTEIEKAHGAAIRMNQAFDRRVQVEQARAIAAEHRRMNDAMVTGRYALYDIANTYRGIYTAARQVTQVLAQGVVQAAKFESAFTSVERALDLEVDSRLFDDLKESIMDLSTQIPVTFEDLSKIATLGAQMGIQAQDIEEFTKTIASFSAVTGVTIENAAEKFGRLASLANVPASEFENLGSAVYFAGVNAVATEEQILSMAEEIAATATKAGFSADAIIGLSTALASVGLQPELSRGALMRIFDFMDRSVAGLTGKLDELAVVMGMTQQQAAALFKENPELFFQRFLAGIGTVDNLTQAFDKLGLVNVRDRDLLTRLSQNMDVYTKSMQDANASYAEGTALSNGYGRQADNLEAMIMKLNNAIAAMGAALGQSTLEGLKPFIEFTIEALNAARDFAQSPIGQAVLPISIGITAAIALMAAFTMALNLAKASVLAMAIGLQKMAEISSSNIFSMRNMIQMVTGQTYAVKLSTKADLDAAVAKKALTAAEREAIITRGYATGQYKLMTVAQMDSAIKEGLLTEAHKKNALAATQATWATRGLTVAMRALQAATVIGLVVSIAGTLADMAGLFGDTGQELYDIGKAGIEAAGGLQALQEAQRQDVADKARNKALKTVTKAQGQYNTALEDSINLYDDYANQEPAVNQFDIDSADAAAGEYARLLASGLRQYATGDAGETKDLFAQLIGLDNIDRAVLEGVGFSVGNMVNEGILNAAATGNQAAQLYVQNLIPSGNQIQTAINFAMSGLTIEDPGLEVTFERAIAKAQELGTISPQLGASLIAAFNASGLSINEFLAKLNGVNFDFLLEAAKSVDATNLAVDTGSQANQEYTNTLIAMGDEAASTASKLGEITDEIYNIIDGIFAGDIAQGETAEAFAQFAQNIIEYGSTLDQFTENGRENLQNFQDFIRAAFEEAELSGTGVTGALNTIGEGLKVMEENGADVSGMMEIFRQLVVETLREAGAAGGEATVGMTLLADEIEGMPPGTTLDIILGKIQGIGAGAIATTGAVVGMVNAVNAAGPLVGGYVPLQPDKTPDWFYPQAPQETLTPPDPEPMESMLDELTKAWEDAWSKIGDSTDKGGSSLKDAEDDLEETGETALVAAGKLDDLGKSIENNGLEFDRWSQAGSQNVMALMAVMDAMRVEAGGDVQQLANWLAALREALIRAGASASAIELINSQIAKLGVTATATAQDIDAMYAALTQQAAESAESVKKSSTKTKKEFMRLAEAISKVASDISKNLDTLFGKERAIDAITLGWLDLKEGSDKARESIADAEQQISDIQNTIDETRASIDGLAADKSKLEYQLSIALKYGDAIRAQEIQAELSKLDAEIAKEQEKIAEAQSNIAEAEEKIRQAQSQLGIDSTVGDIIERNRALEDMAELYGDLAAALMIEAKTQADRTKIIEQQTAAFYANAIAAGFTEEEAKRVADALALSMSQVDIPRNIKDPFFGAGFNTSQAKESIDEFVNWANERLASLTENFNLGSGYQMPDFNWLRPGGFTDGGSGREDSDAGREPTRPGGRPGDEVSTAILDEIRMRASAAVQIGLDYFSPTNLMKPVLGKTGVAIGTGPQNVVITELSPQDRQLLRAALERPITLYADSTEIANTSNRGNTILARRNRR